MARTFFDSDSGARSMTRDAEDEIVDFSSAGLYLAGIQSVFSICVCSIVSVLACWLVPSGSVSAVRTLALCCFFAILLMHRPLRIGRTHGVSVVFASLQPSVALYLVSQVIEQLIHACTQNDVAVPSWRRVVFHAMMAALVFAGFLRARKPMDETDLPFVLTITSLSVVALLPPPSVALVGPLCQSVTVWEAVDRVVRAFTFSVLYAVNVYSITASSGVVYDTLFVFTRSACASIWVLGSHVTWLPLSVLQCIVAIHARVHRASDADAARYTSATE